jgi:hypothetical protein
MELSQARWALRKFASGSKLNSPLIRELYLAGYIEIELLSPEQEPHPTLITEKGKRLLES